MSWAAGRQTTREEDAAYCLQGIFNVFMPTIYGEGCEHAFARLHGFIEALGPKSSVALCAFSSNLGNSHMHQKGMIIHNSYIFISNLTT
jgi:hypothetical protein